MKKAIPNSGGHLESKKCRCKPKVISYKERKHNYLVGYEGEGEVIYGKDGSTGNSTYADPLTLCQARLRVKKLSKNNKHERTIYRLVPKESI